MEAAGSSLGRSDQPNWWNTDADDGATTRMAGSSLGCSEQPRWWNTDADDGAATQMAVQSERVRTADEMCRWSRGRRCRTNGQCWSWNERGGGLCSLESRGVTGFGGGNWERTEDRQMAAASRRTTQESTGMCEPTGRMAERRLGATEDNATAAVGGEAFPDGICMFSCRGCPLVARVLPVRRYCRCGCSRMNGGVCFFPRIGRE